LFVVVVCGAVASARAQEAAPEQLPVAPEAEKKAQEIRVGVYILNLGKFDVSSGAFTVDFYLSMTSEAPFEKGAFEFMNGRASSLDVITDKPNEKFYRIQANLFENVDLKAYPFDRHALTIQIEEKSANNGQVVYVPDEAQSGIDPLVTFVGWELAGQPHGRVLEHDYALYKEKYSRFVYEIAIRRTALAAILKAFVPVGFILLVGLLSLIIRANNVGMRFGLNTSMLLAAVMFHLNLTSSLPPVGYLTFGDKFMIATYVSLGLCLVSTLLLMRHTEQGAEARAKWIFRTALLGVPLITVGLFVGLFVLQRLS
jgi:hypothetical protein